MPNWCEGVLKVRGKKKDLLNEELKNDDDIAFSWNFGDTNVKD